MEIIENFNSKTPLVKRLILIPAALLVLFFLYQGYRTFFYEKDYEINLSDENFNNQDIPLSIKGLGNDEFNHSGVYNGENFKAISNSPVSFIFQPEAFPWNKKIELSATVKSDSNMFVSLYCPNCKGAEQYSYKKLFDKEISSYFFAANFDDFNIYSRENISIKESDDISDWLKNNVSPGQSISIMEEDFPLGLLENSNIADYKGELSKLDGIFLGTQKFYVYLDEDFKTKFNISPQLPIEYLEEINISLKNLDGETVFSDDIRLKKHGLEFLEFEYEVDDPGNYILEISGEIDNFKIQNLQINSNRIVADKSVVAAGPLTAFTEVTEPKDLNLWSEDPDQVITIIDSNDDVVSSIIFDDNQSQNIRLDPGFYSINLAQNSSVKLEGANFAFNSTSYYSPFLFDLSKNDKAAFIISSYMERKSDGWSIVTQQIDKSELKKLANKDILQFFLSMEFFENQNENLDLALNHGFITLAEEDDYTLWGTGDLNEETIASFISDVEAFVADYKSGTNSILPNDFSEEPTIINRNLRGDHSFYLLLSDQLEAEIITKKLNWYNDHSELYANLRDAFTQEIICQISLSLSNDDSSGNEEESSATEIFCPNLEPGAYILEIADASENDDYVIEVIKVNSNKIIAKDQVIPVLPGSLYFEAFEAKNLQFYYWHDNLTQEIEISSEDTSDVIALTKEDKGITVEYEFLPGEWSLNITRGNLNISGSNFSFSSEQWFDPSDYQIPYFITEKKDEDKKPEIKNIKITIL